MPEGKKSTSILVVDEERKTSSRLTPLLQQAGYQVLSAESREHAIELAEQSVPDLVMLDLQAPALLPESPAFRLCSTLKSNLKTRELAVLILCEAKEGDLQVKGQLPSGIQFVQKPIEHGDLLLRVKAELRFKAHLDELRRCYQDLSDKIERSITKTSEDDWIDKECIQDEVKSIVFESSIGRVPGIVNQLLVGIGARLNRRTTNDIALGLHEMILNAIEHGNWGINSDEKSKALEDNKFNDLVEQRQKDPVFSQKKVHIEYRFDGARVIYKIRDEGAGFDWRSFMSKEQTEDLFASNGRGILISRYIFDSIAYNEVGNEVTLEKRLR